MSDLSGQGPVVVILAGGAGTRMQSSRAKVLHTVGGRTLLHHTLEAVEGIDPSQVIVVVGHQSDQVSAQLSEVAPGARLAVQETPSGTGDAVRVGAGLLQGVDGHTSVIVAYADLPLLEADTLRTMVAAHVAEGDAVTVLAGTDGTTDDAGAYVFDFGPLTGALAAVEGRGLDLAAIVAAAHDGGAKVGVFTADDEWQSRGVDDRTDLAAVGAEFNRRQVQRWLRAGVTVVDPASTWIDADVDLAPDVTLLPGCWLAGATSVAAGASIGPDTTVKDSEVGQRATIARSQVELSVIGADATIGPYTRLRPGSQIGERAVVGSFTEIRNACIGADARIGSGVVFAGATAAPANVGEGAVVGAGVLIVPPAEVPAGEVVPAGVVVTSGAMERRRSAADDAAEAAKRGLEEDR